jgi:hypothetical protein
MSLARSIGLNLFRGWLKGDHKLFKATHDSINHRKAGGSVFSRRVGGHPGVQGLGVSQTRNLTTNGLAGNDNLASGWMRLRHRQRCSKIVYLEEIEIQ